MADSRPKSLELRPAQSSRSGGGERERDYGGGREDRGRPPAQSSSNPPRPEPAGKAGKAAANYETSGLLADETNKFNGVVLKWNEPPDGRVPTQKWRLYVFKDDEPLDEPYAIHRQSAYLLGRERRVADIPLDHPSCSSQHAVLQFRETEKLEEDGVRRRRVRPYLMDLNSTNGSYINSEKLEPQRYVELFERDVLKFGYSSRDFVLLHEDSAE
ncbi:SMAD/FHA domain-containing protein [Pavlovales sp. CCMP2436]|nr:SMAD/FHA domain-containing protein [Pavlovales sp. CCMP2436]|mmetsp:Transcript_2574/g.6597  ORF Transcript_2574/g.6597 Transcript_2574/m.6597 type:complete len:214 (-) Transcript_2574:169-810(-)